MVLKQLVLGLAYSKIRSPKIQETNSYSKLVRQLQKSYLDTMNHRRRHIQPPYTLPIFLHRSDVSNQNFNLRKLAKIIMKDMLVPHDKPFEIRFLINERYAQRKHVTSQPEESLRIMLNKISDRPVNLNVETYNYNRNNEIGLYIESNFGKSIMSIKPSDHKDLINLLSTKLIDRYELVNVPKQFYVQFRQSHSKLSHSLKDPAEVVTTKWKQEESELQLAVVLETLELADKVAYIGIHSNHSEFDTLVNKKLINPVTHATIRIVKAPDDVMEGHDSDLLLGLTPNYNLKHREFCLSEKLEFFPISQYDFHSGTYSKKKSLYEEVFDVQKNAPPVIPIILSPTSIRDKESGELFEITKFSMVGYINLEEELKAPIFELLTSTKLNTIPNLRPYPQLSVIVTEDFWLTLMVLKALGLQNRYKVVQAPKIIDFKNRDVSKLRPDFNKMYHGVPIDHVCENFTNQSALFDDKQFPMNKDGAISIDLIRGMLLNLSKEQEGVIFDDSHKTTELLKLTLLMDLLNNFSIKFMKRRLKSILLDVGFENLISDKPDQNIKEWNYYMINRLIKDTKEFFDAKENGDLALMQQIFSNLLVLVTNGYWDLLNSEIMLASKKPENLPNSKIYLKHLMGTIVYYMHIMGQSFYPNESLFVLKKLPLLMEKYSTAAEFDKYEENFEIYNRNIDDLESLNPRLRNYLKMYDNDVLNDGSLIISLVSRLKEVLLLRRDSSDTYSVIIEAQDLLKYFKIQEHQNNINVIYSIFKSKNIKNRMLKIVSDMNSNHIRFNQPQPTPRGLESFAVTNGVFIHVVKDAVGKIHNDELEVEDIAEVLERERELNNKEEGTVTFKEAMISDDIQNLLKGNNSEFDKVFEDIFSIESKRQEELKEQDEELSETRDETLIK